MLSQAVNSPRSERATRPPIHSRTLLQTDETISKLTKIIHLERTISRNTLHLRTCAALENNSLKHYPPNRLNTYRRASPTAADESVNKALGGPTAETSKLYPPYRARRSLR